MALLVEIIYMKGIVNYKSSLCISFCLLPSVTSVLLTLFQCPVWKVSH